MPRGSKTKYTDKQKRQAEHIARGYKERGLSEREAKRRAWATVNWIYGGGELKGGSGYGGPVNRRPARRAAKARTSSR
jgi:plasmid stabilization system protein ParE